MTKFFDRRKRSFAIDGINQNFGDSTCAAERITSIDRSTDLKPSHYQRDKVGKRLVGRSQHRLGVLNLYGAGLFVRLNHAQNGTRPIRKRNGTVVIIPLGAVESCLAGVLIDKRARLIGQRPV